MTANAHEMALCSPFRGQSMTLLDAAAKVDTGRPNGRTVPDSLKSRPPFAVYSS